MLQASPKGAVLLHSAQLLFAVAASAASDYHHLFMADVDLKVETTETGTKQWLSKKDVILSSQRIERKQNMLHVKCLISWRRCIACIWSNC
jgi:hypothetical protein